MFHAIRQQLSAGIESLRSKGLVGLFAFEFTVVLMGVLAAQGLQNWSRELEIKRETLEAEARLQQGFISAKKHAEVWRTGLPCLRERVGEIMVSAAKGQELAGEFANRPLFPRMSDYSEPPGTNARLAETIGIDRTTILIEMPVRIGVIQDASLEIANRWEVFRLMDPAFGPVSMADRAASRVAGAEIISRMRSIEAALAMISRLDGQSPIEGTVPLDPMFDIVPVSNCAEIWAKGTAYRTIEPSEMTRD